MQTSSPWPSGSGSAVGVPHVDGHPEAGPWISPAHTGRVGSPPTKQPQRSVPPEIEARWTSPATASYTQANRSADSGEPVEQIVRRLVRRWVSPGPQTGLGHAVEVLAPTPRTGSRRSGRPGRRGPTAEGWSGLPVEQDDRRLRRQVRHEPVPHHPAAGREVEDAVAGPHVAVELLLAQVLEEQAAGAVDDALRPAGRARRVEDRRRVVERQALEGRARRRLARREVGERADARLGARRRADRRGSRRPRPGAGWAGRRRSSARRSRQSKALPP